MQGPCDALCLMFLRRIVEKMHYISAPLRVTTIQDFIYNLIRPFPPLLDDYVLDCLLAAHLLPRTLLTSLSSPPISSAFPIAHNLLDISPPSPQAHQYGGLMPEKAAAWAATADACATSFRCLQLHKLMHMYQPIHVGPLIITSIFNQHSRELILCPVHSLPRQLQF